jgi:hypothetical protein
MNTPKVKLVMRKLEQTVLKTPVKDWELETYIISELFTKHMAFWKILPSRKKYKIKKNLSMIQAFAVNNYFSATSEEYNMVLRIKIEPFLLMANSN